MKVLLIDDNPADRRILTYYFSTRGWTTAEAADGAEAMAAIAADPPDLIISDAMMPNLDGFQFLHELKKSRFGDIPVVIYTATYCNETEQELALSLGADGYMIKPMDPFRFWAELERILADRDAGRRREVIKDDEEYLRKYTAVLMRKLEEKVRELDAKTEEAEGRSRLETEIEEGRRRVEEARRIDTELLRRAVPPAVPAASPARLLAAPGARDLFLAPLREMETSTIVLLERQGEPLPADAAQHVRHIDASVRLMGKVLEELLRVPGISRSKLLAPLRRVEALTQVLEEDYRAVLAPDEVRALEGIRGAKERMAVMIDDVLEFIRIQQVEIRKEKVDISAIAAEIVRDLAATASATPPAVAVQEGLTAEADPHLIRVVLENLLANAWKFTSKSADPRIEFAAAEGEPTVYAVRDNGIGFDPNVAGGLFSPFCRLHSMEDFPGTGIGLAVVRNVVDRHGGRCWAEGVPDTGATFFFTLR